MGNESTDSMPAVSARGLKVPWPTLITGIIGFATATTVAVAAWVNARNDVHRLREQVLEIRISSDQLNTKREDLSGAMRELNESMRGIGSRLDRIERRLDRKE